MWNDTRVKEQIIQQELSRTVEQVMKPSRKAKIVHRMNRNLESQGKEIVRGESKLRKVKVYNGDRHYKLIGRSSKPKQYIGENVYGEDVTVKRVIESPSEAMWRPW